LEIAPVIRHVLSNCTTLGPFRIFRPALIVTVRNPVERHGFRVIAVSTVYSTPLSLTKNMRQQYRLVNRLFILRDRLYGFSHITSPYLLHVLHNVATSQNYVTESVRYESDIGTRRDDLRSRPPPPPPVSFSWQTVDNTTRNVSYPPRACTRLISRNVNHARLTDSRVTWPLASRVSPVVLRVRVLRCVSSSTGGRPRPTRARPSFRPVAVVGDGVRRARPRSRTVWRSRSETPCEEARARWRGGRRS